MIIRYVTPILLLICLVMRGSGQISHGGVPASFTYLKQATFIIPVVEMAPVVNEDLLREEKAESNRLKTFRFAKSFNVDIDPANSGIWKTISGQKIWCLGIHSKGAYSLNLIFDKMIIPKGASLFIYTPDHSTILGAYTSENELSSGYFTFFPVPGDEIIVEYDEPQNVKIPGQLHILKVNHAYKNAFGTRPLGLSGACNTDVYCPDVLAYVKEKQSVVDLIIGGNVLCTGEMVNNVRQDKTPYLMTAGHCITNANEAPSLLICFNYESPYCGFGRASLNGYADQTLAGSIFKARSDSLDFALVELETIPPAEFRPFYAGWNNSNTIPTSTFSIHHPLGDVKKVSVDQNAPTVDSFSPDFLTNGFWKIGTWEIGTTEDGSSGAPLFNQNKLIVGSLTGGNSKCTSPSDDWFAMFNKQWNHYSSPTQQLKTWLDPDNSGMTQLNSFSPYDSTMACSLFTNMLPDDNYTLQRMGNLAGGYITGHNYLKITNYAEKFEQTSQTLLSAVSIGIAKATSLTENANSNVIIQVFDEDSVHSLPSQQLTSMTIPLSLLSPVKMNFISLDNPLMVKGKYFIGYEINYANSTDTFAVYNTPNRQNIKTNKAYAKQNGNWIPFYAIPQIGISTSMLIDSHGCESKLASGTTPPPGNEVNKFQVLYPQTGISNYVYLRNNGVAEFVSITLYDILGKKISIQQQMVTSVPQVISLQNYNSGVYFLTVESLNGVQVIKIRINKSV